MTRFALNTGRATLVALFLLLIAAPAAARQNFFERTDGPAGGRLETSYRHDNGDLYVGIYATGGVYRSVDNGTTWSQLGDYLPGTASSIAVDDQGRVYAGLFCSFDECSSLGLWRIDAGGTTWSNLVFADREVPAVAIGPAGEIILSSVINDVIVISRSVDGGSSYQTAYSGSDRIDALALHDQAFYAGGENIILHSTDDGQSWTDLAFPCGTLCQSQGYSIRDIELLADGSVVVTASPDGILISTDMGSTWTSRSAGLPFREDGSYEFFDTAVSGTGSILTSLVQGVIFFSNDAGASWTDVGNSEFEKAQYIKTVMIGGDGTLFASLRDQGLLRSDDMGATWTHSSKGINDSSVWELLGGSDGTSYASAGGLLFKTDNAGQSWTLIETPESNSPFGSGWPALSGNGDLFMVGSVHRSSDKGESWLSFETPWDSNEDSFAFAVTINPDGHVFVGTYDAGDGGSIYRSIDRGETWGKLNVTISNLYWIAAGPAGAVYVSEDWPNYEIYASIDNGETWHSAGRPAKEYIAFLTVNENGDVYVGGLDGLQRSTDGGASWTDISNGIPDSPLGSRPFVSSIAFAKPGEIYVGTAGSGVHYSGDNGATWTSVSSGLIDPVIESLAIADGTLLAGTERHGVFASTVKVTAVEKLELAEVPREFTLGQNYPNPFNPSTRIRFEISGATNVELSVFDAMGRRVRTLMNEHLAPGIYEATFDGSGLASGVYSYRLSAGDVVQTKMMSLLK